MLAKVEEVAEARYRCCARRRLKRTLFHQRHFIIEEDLVELRWLETCDLDRRIFQDQFLDFDLELVEVPASLLTEPVQGQA